MLLLLVIVSTGCGKVADSPSTKSDARGKPPQQSGSATAKIDPNHQAKGVPPRILEKFTEDLRNFADKMLKKPGGAKIIGIFLDESINSEYAALNPADKLYLRAVGIETVKQSMHRIAQGFMTDRSEDEKRILGEYLQFIKEEEADPAFKKAQKELAFEDLFKAIRSGSVSDAKAALRDGADVNGQNEAGIPPLTFAMVLGKAEFVGMLCEAGASVNHQVDGKKNKKAEGVSALYMAANNGDAEAVNFLLEKGANKDAKFDGYTPLRIALLRNKLEVVAILKAAGAKETPDNALPEQPKKSSFQDSKPAKSNAGSKKAQSASAFEALFKAIERGTADEAKAALEAGADVNGRHPVSGLCPLHYATGQARLGIAEMLLKGGAKVNEIVTGKNASDPRKTMEGSTALHIAVILRNPAIAQLLIKNGADVNIKAADGWTPLRNTKEYARYEEMAAILKAAGAKE